MGKPLELIGESFGRLTVEARGDNKVSKGGYTRRMWICRCECGKTTTVSTQDLRRGDVSSCGCLKKEINKSFFTQHGLHGTKLHNVWCAMKRRCVDKNYKDYNRYGARGIKVCDEWFNDFICFYNWSIDNGYKDGLTIDRKNVNGNYEPDNCRWIDMRSQCNNRRNNVKLEYDGKCLTIAEWSTFLNIPYSRLYMRYKKGWPVNKILT